MSILDRLLSEVPRNSPTGKLNPQYHLVKEYMAEIAEAKEHGYSWLQIGEAVKQDASEKGRWNENWKRWNIQKLYNQILKAQEE
jgi:hypothetical protein